MPVTQTFARSLCTAFVLVVGLGLQLTTTRSDESFKTSSTAVSPEQPATQNIELELVGLTGAGPLSSATVPGDYAYLGIGPWLVVLDTSDPAHLKTVGQMAVLTGGTGGSVRVVGAFGDHAYVSTPTDLRIVDISSPSRPMQQGTYELSPSSVYAVGSYAYLGWGSCSWVGDRDPIQVCKGGLRIIDVTNRGTPVDLGELVYGKPVRVIRVDNHYAYLVAAGSLRVVDISDPGAPIEVGAHPASGDIFVADGYAYAASGTSGLRVIDISVPTAPVEVGVYAGLESAQSIYVASGYAYVMDRGTTLHVIDVTDATEPVGVSSYYVPDSMPWGTEIVSVAEGYGYLITRTSLHTVDVSDPTMPVGAGVYHTDSIEANGIYVSSQYAYVVTGNGPTVIDVSNPAAPIGVSSIELGSPSAPLYGRVVHVADHYAYVTVASLWIVDISDPTAPLVMSTVPGPVADVYVAGRYAYMTGGGLLRVIDISDPAAPLEVGSHTMPGDIRHIDVSGNHAYVTDSFYTHAGPHTDMGALRIIDISDPSEPAEVGALDLPSYVGDVHVSGTYAYVINRMPSNPETPAGLWIVDVSGPTTPTQAGRHETTNAVGVFVVGRYAFVTDYNAGLRVIDVANPALPTEAGAYSRIACCPQSVYVTDGHVYVAAGDSGLLIFKPTLSASQTYGVYLPIIAKQHETEPARTRYPNHELANRIWQAVERFVEEYPPADIYPGYTPEAGGPSAENARANVETACHDFPDLSDPFGKGVHPRACRQWVAVRLGLYHAVSAYRSDDFSRQDIAWAQHYLDATLDYLAEFVYGPEDCPTGVGYRDTLAAVWQNPVRALGVTILADLLRKQGALSPERQTRVEELLSGIVRAWYAEFWETDRHPTTDVPFTTRTAPEVEAYSLHGHQVVSTEPWTFNWDADKGNTPAEEVAWMGASVMLASRALSNRMPDAGEIYAAARHYLDFAIAYDRPDPLHGGTVRTLNAETEGGAYGQRRYWIENHTADMPSLPYMGATWNFVQAALLASELGDQQPWPSLVPDDTQWDVLLRSAGETMRAADGTFLVDFTPGRRIGYNLDHFPEWWTACSEGQPGRQYVRYDGRAGGPELFISEAGSTAGIDLLITGWPIMRIAAHRGDEDSYAVWEDRLNKILDEYIASPPNPYWATCKTAVYVSSNPGFHWPLDLVLYMTPYLGASGYELEPW